MSLLIYTFRGDYHALVVATVIECEYGEKCTRIFLDDFPHKQSFDARFRQADNHAEISIFSADQCSNLNADVVWYRRFADARKPEDLHVGDREVFRDSWREIGLFTRSRPVPEAFEVNPSSSKSYRTDKLNQHEIAASLGVRLPDTLISNSPTSIESFCESNWRDGHEVIIKPFAPVSWYNFETGVGYSFATQLLDREVLKSSDLSSAPAIYQRRIDKAYEVRVTTMGSCHLAIKFVAHDSDSSKLDFRRSLDWSGMNAEIIEIPENITDFLSKLYRQMNLVFGCADFIVDPEGNWFFLETNPMGNFLWCENICPSLRLLSTFCDFLMSRDPEFSRYSTNLKLADIEQKYDIPQLFNNEVAQLPPGKGLGSSAIHGVE